MGSNGKLATTLGVHSEYLSYLAHAYSGIGHFDGIYIHQK